MTYLTTPQVKTIVHLSGTHIRIFLGNADPKDFAGDASASIAMFHEAPASFSDEALLEKGANVDDAHQYPVRIELRGINSEGAAQVVAKGIWGKAREKAIQALRKELQGQPYPLLVRTAGSSSFEFNRRGVDKSLPIRYLRARWEQVLDQMGYVPGKGINSRLSRIVIAADGDGTIYDGPRTTHLPVLKDSPAYAPLIGYLRAGGIFMLVSGNDLTRSFKRLAKGLPEEIYSRVLLAANGGADLACLSPAGKMVFIKDYRQCALDIAAKDQEKPSLDIVYIGDDAAPHGNDQAAFEAVGPSKAVLVKSLLDTKVFLEKWMHERKINFI